MTTEVEATPTRRLRNVAYIRAGVLVAAVLAVDQLTKHLVRSGIEFGDAHHLLPAVNLVHVINRGVAFGFLSEGGPAVFVFTFVALVALIVYFARHPTRRWLWLPSGLLIGGALGNLLDRLLNGAVTDFIKFPLWPAFNVADMSITFGVLALLWVLEGRRGRS